MATFISENTDAHMPILCRYCDTGLGERFHEQPTRVAAVRLRGQWQGGDVDVDPHWVPVCWEHDSSWDVDDNGQEVEVRYRLPLFDLPNWWVVIERDDPAKDLVIGPYPDEHSAARARDESLLVQSELEEGGTDCFVQSALGIIPGNDQVEVVLIHLDDPTYTGKEQP